MAADMEAQLDRMPNRRHKEKFAELASVAKLAKVAGEPVRAQRNFPIFSG